MGDTRDGDKWTPGDGGHQGWDVGYGVQGDMRYGGQQGWRYGDMWDTRDGNVGTPGNEGCQGCDMRYGDIRVGTWDMEDTRTRGHQVWGHEGHQGWRTWDMGDTWEWAHGDVGHQGLGTPGMVSPGMGYGRCGTLGIGDTWE